MPALGRVSSREGWEGGGGYSTNVYTERLRPEFLDLVPSFVDPLQTSAHMYRLNTRSVKANQVLLLVIKKVYFKSCGIGVVTVYHVYHLFA